ncbi:hypothetical protein KM043_017651 [Ampulex compressa]|nr:hypothetical protein KM043_017651 [Ampulex compressa]
MIVETFVKSYVSIFGPPKNILTDNGTNFTGQLMKEFNDWMKMKHITTTAFHPESNGSLERSHQVIKVYLKTTAEDLNKWDDYVEMACYSYNSATHKATGYTPYELVYGTKPRNLASTDKLAAKTYSEYIEELKRRTERIVTTARQQINASKEKIKERYDSFRRPAKFKPGDFVWMTRETRDKISGLYIPYEGPYEIIDKEGDVNYKIRKKNKDIVMHANRLKYVNMNLFQDNDGPTRPE